MPDISIFNLESIVPHTMIMLCSYYETWWIMLWNMMTIVWSYYETWSPWYGLDMIVIMKWPNNHSMTMVRMFGHPGYFFELVSLNFLKSITTHFDWNLSTIWSVLTTVNLVAVAICKFKQLAELVPRLEWNSSNFIWIERSWFVCKVATQRRLKFQNVQSTTGELFLKQLINRITIDKGIPLNFELSWGLNDISVTTSLIFLYM